MAYIDIAREKLNLVRDKEKFYILAIESSCDETAVSIIYGKEVLANEISSQIEIHKCFA